MRRIHIENDFSQWAGYLARYFGTNIIIYSDEGDLMWGDTTTKYRSPNYMLRDKHIKPVYSDIGIVCAYIDTIKLTYNECQILDIIIPFIESQLDDEGA